MRPDYDFRSCRIGMRRDIEAVFDRDRVWLGMFQVRARLNVEPGDSGGPDWKLFQSVLAEMIGHGLLIYSFSPKHDQFPRYLLSRLMNRGD